MKRFLLLIVVLGLAVCLGAQSLADLAKSEKARRESLKGQHAVVVRNADLLKLQKAPAVQITIPEEIGGETVSEETEPSSLPSGSGAPSGRRIVPSVAPNGPLITGDVNRDQAEGRGTLEAQLKAANELVDLLTTKMAALRQQFESQDAMVPGYVIQQQLDEMGQRLVKAEAQQARIEAMIENNGAAKKVPGKPER